MDKIYHIGLSKQGNTMVIEARLNVNCLSCEIYDYMGKHLTTKAKLNNNRYEVLRLMKQKRPDVYGNLKYAIVD